MALNPGALVHMPHSVHKGLRLGPPRESTAHFTCRVLIGITGVFAEPAPRPFGRKMEAVCLTPAHCLLVTSRAVAGLSAVSYQFSQGDGQI